MVLCDIVHRDALSNKHTIVGTFSTFTAKSFPAKIGFCIYFAITDGLGEQDIKIRFVESSEAFSDDGKALVEVVAKVNFEDPLIVVEGSCAVSLELPKAAVYHCELYSGDTLLMSRRMSACEILPPDPKQEGEQS